ASVTVPKSLLSVKITSDGPLTSLRLPADMLRVAVEQPLRIRTQQSAAFTSHPPIRSRSTRAWGRATPVETLDEARESGSSPSSGHARSQARGDKTAGR